MHNNGPSWRRTDDFSRACTGSAHEGGSRHEGQARHHRAGGGRAVRRSADPVVVPPGRGRREPGGRGPGQFRRDRAGAGAPRPHPRRQGTCAGRDQSGHRAGRRPPEAHGRRAQPARAGPGARPRHHARGGRTSASTTSAICRSKPSTSPNPSPTTRPQYVLEHREDFPATRITSSFVRVYPRGDARRPRARVHGPDQRRGVRGEQGQAATRWTTRSERAASSRPSKASSAGSRSSRRCRSTTAGSRSASRWSARQSPATTCSSTSTSTRRRSPRTRLRRAWTAPADLIDPDHGRLLRGHRWRGRGTRRPHGRGGGIVVGADVRSERDRHGRAPPAYFDPNGQLPLIDRALSPYAPGSTFKLFSAMATLKYGIRPPTRRSTTTAASSSETTSSGATRGRASTVRRLASRPHRLE